jgi:hypothetical protein
VPGEEVAGEGVGCEIGSLGVIERVMAWTLSRSMSDGLQVQQEKGWHTRERCPLRRGNHLSTACASRAGTRAGR